MTLSPWKAFTRLRGSMAAQISLAIGLMSVVIIAGSGYAMNSMLERALREENELMLISNLAFIRDDLAAGDYDLKRVAPGLVDLTERRVHRLHAEILDEQRRIIASSPKFPVPIEHLPSNVMPSDELKSHLSVMQIDGERDRFDSATSVWISPEGRHFRMLVGRINIPATAAAPASSVLVALAVQPTETLRLRRDDQRETVAALVLAAVLAVLLGIWIARRIVTGAKRLGVAASRISAQALHERLPLEGTPTELIESTLAFNGMLDRLQQSFDRLSAFSSDLAHDFRTPIGNLLGEAQVALSRSRTADEYRAVLESAVEEYERLSRMIGNMLFLARAENEQAPLNAGWVEADAVLARVSAYFEQIAEERGVELKRTLLVEPGTPAQFWADDGLLTRALSNLVSNALRYAPQGSRIDLAATVAADRACVIEVANDGPPIAPEHQARIFERFFRADASREGSASGSGLGLAIVRSIMALHGGEASVRSGPRTVFRLSFPAPRGG